MAGRKQKKYKKDKRKNFIREKKIYCGKEWLEVDIVPVTNIPEAGKKKTGVTCPASPSRPFSSGCNLSQFIKPIISTVRRYSASFVLFQFKKNDYKYSFKKLREMAKTPEDKEVWRRQYKGYEPVKIDYRYNIYTSFIFMTYVYINTNFQNNHLLYCLNV